MRRSREVEGLCFGVFDKVWGGRVRLQRSKGFCRVDP